MENTPDNNLISDACDKIASGYDFGGWTDPLDERTLGPAEARAVNKNQQDKFKTVTRNQSNIDKFLKKSRQTRINAQAKDDRLRQNTLKIRSR